MDEYTRAYYELAFQVAFMERHGDDFQNLFSTIMEKRYPGDFVRVRPWGNQGDRKNDGYLRSRRMLFQCHAPFANEADRLAKIDEDFHGALPYRKDWFGEWVFVHNDRGGLAPRVLTRLLELSRDNAPVTALNWGFEELRQEAMNLKQADLSSLLGPAPSMRGMLDLGLEELVPVLDHVSRLHPTLDPDLRPVPADKLQRNLLSNAVAILLRAGMSRAGLVRSYFELKPTLQDQIATSFAGAYVKASSAGESPDEVFVSLQRFAGGDQVNPAHRQEAVLAVLAFFFEECDIFERPEEGGGTSS